MRGYGNVLGSFVGLALGDALGGPIEFQTKGTFPEVTDFVGGGVFGLKPGEWTDDTSMALCLAHSIIEKDFDPSDQLDRYVRWYQEGYMSSRGMCFDIGTTTSSALHDYMRTGQVAAQYHDSTFPRSNGSIMRLAPVALAYHRNPVVAINLAGESSRTTHNSRIQIQACQYLAMLIIGFIQGYDKKTVLAPDFFPDGAKKYWSGREIEGYLADVKDGWHRTPDYNPGSTSEVITTLASALWAFETTENFKDGAIAAVNLGGDTDTIGAVYGQIAGAYYGYQNLPHSWIVKLVDWKLLFETGEKLYEHSRELAYS